MAETRMPEKNLLKDNSNQARGEQLAKPKEISAKPLAKGTLRKRNIAMRLTDIFFEGSARDAVDYMINDIAIPQIKNAVLKGIEVMFYGGASGSNYSRPNYSNSNTPYNSYFVGRDGVRKDNTSSRPLRRGDSDDAEKIKKIYDPRLIVVEDRGEAEMVLEQLKKDLMDYPDVSVQTLFNLVNIESDWTSTSYGWKKGDLDNARVKPCADGYYFDLPAPRPID